MPLFTLFVGLCFTLFFIPMEIAIKDRNSFISVSKGGAPPKITFCAGYVGDPNKAIVVQCTPEQVKEFIDGIQYLVSQSTF